VRNEEIGERAPLLQIAQEIDDLRLHRHVERRGRFVQHDELRIERHRARDGDALALPAGEFVGVAVHGRGVEPGVTKRARDGRAALSRVEPRLLRDQPFLDDLGDREARRKRTVGVLKHDLHIAAQRTHLSDGKPVDAAPAIEDRSLRADEAQDRQPESRLSRSRLADDADGLALAHGQRNAVDRFHVADGAAQKAALDREPDAHVGDGHDRPGRAVEARGRALGFGREQHLGVIVLRIGEDFGGLARFDDAALLHHRDVAGDPAHDAEVVGDEQ
jgi:hypothetical protein